MAHFAQVDEGGIVCDVITINNEDCGGGDFPASEPIGQAFINGPHPDCLALAGTWWQTSYNNNFRGVYAGIDYSFNGVDFIPPGDPAPTADDYTTQPEPVIEAP